MFDATMTIDGQATPGVADRGVINPATGTEFTRVPDCMRAQLDAAMDTAARAYTAWRRDEARLAVGALRVPVCPGPTERAPARTHSLR